MKKVLFIVLIIFSLYLFYFLNSIFPVLAGNGGNTPQWFDNSTNNTNANEPTLFSLNWTDSVGLSGYIFSTNNTGTWENDSFVSFANTFGKTDIGADGYWPYADATHGRTLACRFTAPENGLMTDITAYIWVGSGVTAIGYATVYNDSAGNPSSLIAVGTVGKTINSTERWITFDFDSPVPIVGGTAYHLAVSLIPDAGTSVYYKFDAGDTGQQQNSVYDNPPPEDPWPGSNTIDDWEMSIYATYTPLVSWSNVTKTLNSTEDAVVQWRVFANDTSNNWNASLVYSLTITYETMPYFSGFLKDINDDPVLASVSLDSFTTTTNASGYYKISAPFGIYDARFDIPLFIPNFWLKMLSMNIMSPNRLTHITDYTTENKISMIFNLTDDQIIQTYSPNKPNRILINGTAIQEVSSLSSLTSDTWYYNSFENILYINSSGSVPLTWLHTDGKYIKDELGNIISLRGCAFIEAAYLSDRCGGSPAGTLTQRAERFKELGVNYVRLEINQDAWDENRDTNGDGIGNVNFTMQAIQEFTSRGIYVIPGLHGSISENFYTDTQAWIDWLIDNIVTPNLDNPGVAGIYIWNEPHYDRWSGTDVGGGITSGYWDAVKQVCQAVHEANPNLLMIVHANTGAGFSPVLGTDPIPVPNVVYTWHYYYVYASVFNPYLGWMSGVLDPDWQEMVNRGQPFYQSYHFGNYTKARQEFEQWLYDDYLWVPTELNLPIVNDEFAFAGEAEHYSSYRACTACLEANGGVVERGVTFWIVSDTLDAPDGNKVTKSVVLPSGTRIYPDPTYCPICGAPIPRPREDFEPGHPQCMHDFIQILNKYNCSWSYYAWWGAEYKAGYGLVLSSDMDTLTERGEAWKDYLSH